MMSKNSKSHGRHRARQLLKPHPLLEHQQSTSSSWVAKVITLFPDMFPGTLNYSVLGRALRENIWSMEVINLRDFGVGKHKDVDDTPSGGGPGMILRPDVVDNAVAAATKHIGTTKADWPIINLSPRGTPLTQGIAKELSKKSGVILLCGRFEGIDQRVIEKWKMRELSLGDFVLSGGEIAAQALIDAVVRNIPTVLGNELSLKNESFSSGFLEHPQYTKPTNWNGELVPSILLSGNHAKVYEWQAQKSMELTINRRPDLLPKSKKPANSQDN